MATDLERLVVQLSADITKYERSLNRANGIANTRTRQIESRFKRMQSTIGGSFDGIAAGATRAFAAIGGAKAFQSLSDAGTQITNSLRIAGLEGEELTKVYNDLREAALKNAAPFNALTQLYSRIALAQNELGVSSQDITKFSENTALALRVGGRSAQESAGALLQLSQALGEGIVRSQEFNSLIEGAPALLQAAAAGIKQADGSVSKLRQIMLAGNLSSKAFFDGVQAGAYTLEGRVATAVFTISQRLENLQTVLIDSVRQFNESTGAAETLGEEIDKLARYIQSINFNNLIAQIQEVYGALSTGYAIARDFVAELGKLQGTGGFGSSIVEALGGKNGKASFFGGALTISDVNYDPQNKLNELTEKRLKIEREIQSIRENPNASITAVSEIRLLEANLRTFQQEADKLTKEAINKLPLNTLNGAPVLRAENKAGDKPLVDVEDEKYRTTASGSGGSKDKAARKERLDDYAKEVVRIREKTDALNAETAAQAALNPLINDYGYAANFAAAQQELTNAAINAGLQVTPELARDIEVLAGAYAQSSAAADQLAESQDKIRERQEEILNVQKDVTRGLIDDLLEGKSAAEAFAGALKKIASALLDSAFNNFFKSTADGGGGGFGGLFKLLGFAGGGYTGAGGKYDPAGIVHKGEYVIPKSLVDKIGVKQIERLFGGYANGGLVGGGLSRSSPSGLNSSSSLGGGSFVFSPQIDARGASVEAVARLDDAVRRLNREFEGRVTATVRRNGQRNIK